MEAPPSPLSSRPERSGVERSAVLLFLDRSCGPQPPSPLSSRPERSVVERSPVRLSSTVAADHNCPPLCHLDRSAAEWRDLRSCFSLTAAADHNEPPC